MRTIIIRDTEAKRDRFEIEHAGRIYVASRLGELVRRVKQLLMEPEDIAPALHPRDEKNTLDPQGNNSISAADVAMAELPGRLAAIRERREAEEKQQ